MLESGKDKNEASSHRQSSSKQLSKSLVEHGYYGEVAETNVSGIPLEAGFAVPVFFLLTFAMCVEGMIRLMKVKATAADAHSELVYKPTMNRMTSL